MTTKDFDYRKAAIEARIAKLENSEKNIKCPGVLRRLRRELRNLNK